MSTFAKNIVALHGAGFTAGVWDSLTPHLAGYSVRALTLPGRGASAHADGIDAMAKYVREKIAGTACILMGHSMGALVALAAADDPAVQGLILLGAAAEMPVNADLLKTAFEKPDDAAKLVLKWGVFSGNPHAEDIRANTEVSMYPAALGPDLKACNDFRDGARRAAAIKKPVLVLSGAADKMAKAEAGQALAGLIPGAVYHAVPGCGHMLMTEKPAEISFQIKSFLER